ncbi:MAG: hypothetical protein FJW53_06615 [Actinobacteria bacterium]|nr:hypothetical protein [Actinomycetota bacterium]
MSTRGRRSRFGAGALASRLFADLALVLAFVFLDSTSVGQGVRRTGVAATTSTTTTLPPIGSGSPGANSGARPQPYKVTITATPRTSAQTIFGRVERELARLENKSSRSGEIYLVVIGNGGSRGVARSVGSELARAVVAKLEARWNKVVKGTTYFVQ